MTYDLAALRSREFPWTGKGGSTYLNNASTGPLPQRTLDAVTHALQLRADPSCFPDALLFETFTKARALAARLINAAPRQIALCTNTSYGINLAAFALPLEPGDVVLAPDGEFPANVYPWMAAADRRGIVYRQVPARADGSVDEAALLEALTDPSVRAVALSWVSFSTGYRCDVETIGNACRANNAYFVVDAIQGLGAFELDVQTSAIDILACGAQKWLLSPWGTGFTYVREGLIGELDPHVVGWTATRGGDDFSRLLDYDLTWRDDARRFESLTLPAHDFIGFNASLELLLELGVADVERHVTSLVGEIVRWAEARTEVVLATPRAAAQRAGIVSLRLPDAVKASRRLHDAGVAHSLREGLVRLSPHLFNTSEEIERALSVLDESLTADV